MSIEERLDIIETFLQSFCALQLIHQGLIYATSEEREALELMIASTLEDWKSR